MRLAEVYKRAGKAHSNDAEVDADILANFVGTKLLTDENAIRYVVGYKRSFGVWMHEQITRLKAALGNRNAQTQTFLDKAARLYHEALTENKNAGRNSEKNKYSISHTRRMNWRDQVEGYFRQNGSIKSSDSLYLGTSKSTLSEKGIPDAPLYVPTSIINKATRKPKGSKSGHSLTQNDILSLAEGIKNAPIIIHNPARNALIYVTSNQNASGQNIVAVFDLNNDLHGENAHRATSIHGRDSVAAMLKNLGSDSTVFITNENGFNDIAGLQSNITSELLAKVESIENTISEAGENVNSSSKKSFSVSEIQGENEDYGQGVILDTELFKGISPRNWGKVLREFFYNNLAGKEFTAYDEDGRSEVIHLARENDRVQKNGSVNNHKVADKLARYGGDNIRALTTVHIPEAIETSRYKSASDEHSHQWMDSKGWEYRTVYLQDKRGEIYEAELNIAHGNDRLILYDITNIKEIDQNKNKKREASEGVVGSSGRINTAGDLAHYPDASDEIISDNNKNVNSFSKKSFSLEDVPNRENRTDVIKEQDVTALRSIGRKSVNDFTSEDIKIAEPFARRYFAEMGVKSPFFCAWFGDWRANDITPIKTVPVETIDIQGVVMQSGDYHINDTGWNVHAGKTLREETKHYSRNEKVSVKALSAIEEILNNAILFDTEISENTSNNKSVNTAFMHKLYAPIKYNGSTYIAKVSVEEYLSPADTIERKAYHLQGIKIETADGPATDSRSASRSRSDTVSIDTISDLFNFVKAFAK